MRHILFVCLVIAGLWLMSIASTATGDDRCTPTTPDSLGPFYEPDAPQRSSVGEGYRLTGTIKSAADCAPIPKARVEFWLTNPEGDYDARHRATVVADDDGAYRFESNRPEDYGFRPPHIHIRVTAAGFLPLVTQHYPEERASEAVFDLVLIPRN